MKKIVLVVGLMLIGLLLFGCTQEVSLSEADKERVPTQAELSELGFGYISDLPKGKTMFGVVTGIVSNNDSTYSGEEYAITIFINNDESILSKDSFKESVFEGRNNAIEYILSVGGIFEEKEVEIIDGMLYDKLYHEQDNKEIFIVYGIVNEKVGVLISLSFEKGKYSKEQMLGLVDLLIKKNS